MEEVRKVILWTEKCWVQRCELCRISRDLRQRAAKEHVRKQVKSERLQGFHLPQISSLGHHWRGKTFPQQERRQYKWLGANYRGILITKKQAEEQLFFGPG